MNHEEVCNCGVKFLKKYGCSIILKEFVAADFENPDVLGFKASSSLLLEAKISRSDFLADKKKFTRRSPKHGVGNFRFYICPNGLIKKEELPKDWGLIYANSESKYEVVVGPDGNWINPVGDVGWQESNEKAEKLILISALRRVDKTKLKDCNYKVYFLEETIK